MITADTTLYTADTTFLTADGGIIGAGVSADSVLWTADTICVTADGRVICIDADVVETATALDAFDATVDVSGAIVAAVAEAADALDQLDASVEAEVVGIVAGGAHYPRLQPVPVYGIGFGILPQLEGEAHGIVVIAGPGAAALADLRGKAAGSAGVAGRSAAQIPLVHAAAIGARGEVGQADAILKSFTIVGEGTISVHGVGAGMIVLELKGAAIGQYDDDEAAAVMTFLLAA